MTIIELMFVSAIIGILGTIAIPAYSKYLGRSRTTEAKLALGGVFIAEKGYYAENGTYTACLNQAGYAPLANASKYYSIGIATVPANGCGPTGGLDCLRWYWTGAAVTCNAASDAMFVANATAFPGAGIFANDANFEACVGGTNVTEGTFIAGACGNVNSQSTIHDGWVIDNVKALNNTLSGI
jgi:type II secretory pathway pseudopilin PulG